MYQVCAEGGGGAVSVRDFVYLRHWELVDGVYVCAMTSTKHSSVPEKPKRVRYVISCIKRVSMNFILIKSYLTEKYNFLLINNIFLQGRIWTLLFCDQSK
jgi:hypothetical protein